MSLTVYRTERALPVVRGNTTTMERLVQWLVMDVPTGDILAEYETAQEANALARGVGIGEERLRAKLRTAMKAVL